MDANTIMMLILSALEAIAVAELSRAEWITVGMALKHAGLPCSAWDDWSRNDSRYRPGECARIWESFKGASTPITAATIIRMAKDRGWTAPAADLAMDWDDTITCHEAKIVAHPSVLSPVQQLITYLSQLYLPTDYVSYVTTDMWQGSDGKWHPAKGVYTRTVGDLLASLQEHPDDLAATIGQWPTEAGALIRINPVDGNGIRDSNITTYRHALVESDTLPIDIQHRIYKQLQLPIACLVHSGNKSLHAIVRVDAASATEYRERVDYLYNYLAQHGLDVDVQNRNPSRLSRMPGVTRGDNQQSLIATNMGKPNWDAWIDYITTITDDGLPDIVSLDMYADNPPALSPPLIDGILRRAHKLLLAGPSKAGKSFLAMELGVAIAEGIPWLGYNCTQGKVLYVNLEIDEPSCINRFDKIYKALGITQPVRKNLDVWNLRGHAIPLDQLAPKLINRVKGQHYDAIIIDPIYKIITGDENNASEMGKFCNLFDKICTETGCSVIYCHHHSKGAQGSKRAMDRASGSGVFARDPDGQLDFIETHQNDEIRAKSPYPNATSWRMESSLREFPNIDPVDIWFAYPIHIVDTTGLLADAHPDGSTQSNLSKSSKRTAPANRRENLDNAYNKCATNPPVTVRTLAQAMDMSEKTVYRYIDEFADIYWCSSGVVGRKPGK